MLRLEKYPHRMNFAKGILESRKQHYRHLRRVLKPIPMNTPTTIELSPRQQIRVTLFDANHCVGAVIFLIEDEKKAVLYTGDIRSEPWWVESFIRSPYIVRYAKGLKTLDTIYLDTTFASKDESCSSFPTKANGIAELLEKVLEYSSHTSFHLHAWTFGYEDVWLALSAALDSKVGGPYCFDKESIVDSSTDSCRRIYFITLSRACFLQQSPLSVRRGSCVWGIFAWKPCANWLFD